MLGWPCTPYSTNVYYRLVRCTIDRFIIFRSGLLGRNGNGIAIGMNSRMNVVRVTV